MNNVEIDVKNEIQKVKAPKIELQPENSGTRYSKNNQDGVVTKKSKRKKKKNKLKNDLNQKDNNVGDLSSHKLSEEEKEIEINKQERKNEQVLNEVQNIRTPPLTGSLFANQQNMIAEMKENNNLIKGESSLGKKENSNKASKEMNENICHFQTLEELESIMRSITVTEIDRQE